MLPLLLLSLSARAEDIVVSSTVDGATIFVNGSDSGVLTPGTVKAPAGRVQISVEKGCQRGEAVVDVARGGTARVSISPQATPGSLVVNVQPDDAALEFDGRPYPGVLGVPVEVDCGRHTLRATRDGFIPAVITLDTAAGRQDQAALALVPLASGTLEVRVLPREATIWVDGRPLGTGTVSLPTVYEGMHTVGARLDGHEDAIASVDVRGGEHLVYDVELQKGRRKGTVSLVDRRNAATRPASSAEVRLPAPPVAPPPAEPPPPARRNETRAAGANPTDIRVSTPATAKAAPVGRWVLLGGTGAAAAFTGWSYVRTASAYGAYQDRVETYTPEAADRFYDQNVIPRRRLMWGGAAFTTVLTGATIASFALETGPARLAPMPGGGLLEWSGSF